MHIATIEVAENFDIKSVLKFFKILNINTPMIIAVRWRFIK